MFNSKKAIEILERIKTRKAAIERQRIIDKMDARMEASWKKMKAEIERCHNNHHWKNIDPSRFKTKCGESWWKIK